MPIAFFEDINGDIWLDRLWHHDLMAHTNYISDLTVLAPRIPKSYATDPDLVKVQFPTATSLRFNALPYSHSLLSALLQTPITAMTILASVRRVSIVHSGVVGWPFPPGLFANPLAKILGKTLIIVVESSPWRLLKNEAAGTIKKVRARWTEAFGRWSTKVSDLSIFTSQSYLDTIGSRCTNAIVEPASWINAENILTDDEANNVWARKPAQLQILFAGQLVHSKGVTTLAKALKLLDDRGLVVTCAMIGAGPLKETIAQAASQFHHVEFSLLQPKPYGREFFELLQKYHAIVIPSLSDEQPRMMFDAYSQALPVLASDTSGHRDFVKENITGHLFTAGDANQLAGLLERLVGALDNLQNLGQNALRLARERTHGAMHLRREHLIQALIKD